MAAVLDDELEPESMGAGDEEGTSEVEGAGEGGSEGDNDGDGEPMVQDDSEGCNVG